jgi:DNA-binding transcriptional LysR family regulator
VQAVAQGAADIGVFAVAHELDLSGVDVMPYRKDRLVAVVPRSHPFAARPSVSFEDLLAEKLIPARAMLGAFRAAARRLGREFNPKYHVVSGGVAISLVQAGLGVTVQPECLVGQALFDTVAAVDLAEPWANRVISIATARGRTPSPATRALISQLVDRPRLAGAEPDLGAAPSA